MPDGTAKMAIDRMPTQVAKSFPADVIGAKSAYPPMSPMYCDMDHSMACHIEEKSSGWAAFSTLWRSTDRMKVSSRRICMEMESSDFFLRVAEMMKLNDFRNRASLSRRSMRKTLSVAQDPPGTTKEMAAGRMATTSITEYGVTRKRSRPPKPEYLGSRRSAVQILKPSSTVKRAVQVQLMVSRQRATEEVTG